MLTWYEIGLASALVGCVHVLVLPEDDTPLNFLYVWLNKLEAKGSMWYNPLGGCILCFSGQLAFWTSVILNPPAILAHFWAAAAAIVSAYFIAELWERAKR